MRGTPACAAVRRARARRVHIRGIAGGAPPGNRLFVTCGMGFSLLAMRIHAPPQVVFLALRLPSGRPSQPERGTRPRLRGGGAGASDRSGGADDERADQRRDSGQGRERHEEARLLRTGSFGQRRRVPPLARLPSQELEASAVCRWAFPGGCVAARAASLPGAPVLDEPGRAPRSGPRPSFVGAAVCSSHSARLRSGRFGQRSSDSMTSRRWVAAKSAGTSGGRRTRDSRGLGGRAVTVGVGDAMNSPCGVEDRSALGVQASTGVSPGSVGGGASSAAR